MRYIVERITEKWVICEREDGEPENIAPDQFPADLKEGDIAVKEDGRIWIDKEATALRRNQMKKRLRDLR